MNQVQGAQIKERTQRALFTGEAFFKVEGVNLPKPDLVKLKGNLTDKDYKSFKTIYDSGDPAKVDKLKDDQKSKYNSFKNLHERMNVEYINIMINGRPLTKIVFHLSFNPNEELGTEGKYSDRVIVDYPVFISKDLETNKVGDKIRVIDDHNQSIWIKYDPAKDAKTLTIEAMSDPNNAGKSYYQRIDPETSRFAKVGEVLLYDFIFNMTTLHRHNPDKERDLSNFVLGGDATKASELFDKIVDGDFPPVQQCLNSNMTKHSSGDIARVGAMLGVRINDSDPTNLKFYQEVYTSRRAAATFREVYSRENKYDNHTTRLSKDVYEAITDATYPWKCYWGNTFDFKLFDKKKYRPQASGASGNTQAAEDDLPF